MALRDVVLADNPTNYWEFTETSGSTLTATTGGATMSVVGSVLLNQTGPGIGTKAVTSAGGYMTSAYAQIMSTTGVLGIEFWFKIPTGGASGTNETPTLMRRDGGGAAILMRYRESTITGGAKKFETYINGRSRYSSIDVNDGQWHHYVMNWSGGGTAPTEYLDGVAVTSWWGTSTGSVSLANQGTSNPIYWLAESAGVEVAGDISLAHVAIYPAALSEGRINAHYQAGKVTDGVITVVGPYTTINTYNTYVPDLVLDLSGLAGKTLSGNVTITLTASPAQSALPAVVLTMKTPDGTEYPHTGFPAGGSTKTFTFPASKLQPYVGNSAVNIGLKSNSGSTLNWVGTVGTVGQRPVATVSFSVNAGYTAQAMTASSLMVNPAVSTSSNASYTAQAMTASALMVNSTVSAIGNASVNAAAMTAETVMLDPTVNGENLPDANYDAQPMTASALMLDPVVVAGSEAVVTVTGTMNASALMNGATFSSETPVNFVATPMLGNASLKTPKYINGNDISFLEDPYYILAQSTTDNDDIWYRFRETDGATVVVDEKAGDKNGKLYGNPTFVQGFATHRAMVFDGIDDYIQVPDRTISDPALDPGSLEFYIKTDGKTQSIMTGRGYNSIRPGTPGTIGQYELIKVSDIDLVDGKIRITNRSEFYPDNPIVSQLMGTKDIADGQWHQVVLTTWWYPNRYDQGTVPRYDDVIDFNTSLGLSGITVYVDGKVDLRKAIGDPGSGTVVYIGSPDTIGRIGNSYFRGELSELIHRSYYSVPKYYIEQLKYAFFDENPVRAEVMRADASMGNTKAKGNTKRILCLYFRQGAETFTGEGGYSPGLDKTWALDTGFNFQPKFGGMVGNPNTTNNVLGPEDAIVGPVGSKLFFKSVYFDENAPLKPGVVRGYRDPITDDLRYINLQNDIDITEFDAIMFSDFPGVEYEVSNMPIRIRGQEFDKFIESLKVAVFDQGVSLYCAMPHVAEYLGIVDRWDAHTIKRDSFTIVNSSQVGIGGGDFESAYNDPFVNTETYLDRVTPARSQIAADNWKYYYDTHTNSKHRIVAKIEGITDIPGYTLAEETYFRNPAYDYIQDLQYSARFEEHPIGVQIGDEFKFSGPLAQTDDYGRPGQVPWQDYNLISFRPEDINVGTVVAKQQALLNDGFLEYANPEADYATVIVVEPGSVLDGRVINGKIVIDSNDYYGFVTSAMIQDLDSPDWENWWGEENENAVTRQWNPSTRRVRTSTIKVSFTNNKVITGKNGAQAIIVETYSRELSQYGNVVSKPIRLVTMQERLWSYILESQSESGDGDIKFRATPMLASARTVDPETSGIRNASASAQPMSAIARMTKVAEDENGDEQVFAFPMTASASMPNVEKRIYAEPMIAGALMEEPFGMIFDSEDIIYVTLTRPGTITMIRNGDSQ